MPTYIIQPNGPLALDSYLEEDDSAARHGFADEMKFGAEIGSLATHAVLELPLRAIPAGAVVGSGTQLELVVGTAPGSTMSNAECQRLNRRGWDQPSVTWDRFMEGSDWTTPGGDVAISEPLAPTFTVSTSGDITISGTTFEAMVQDALDNRGGILSILLRGEPDETQTVSIRSGQFSDRSKAPKLTVVTTETALGFIYKGGKRAVSSWVIAGKEPLQAARFMAIGVGTVADLSTKRRLAGEVARVPIAGSTLDLLARRVDVWGAFPAGVGTSDATFPITEVALFAGDEVQQIESFDSLAGWSVNTGTLSLETTDHREGAAALKWSDIPTGAGPHTLTKSGLSVDLNRCNLDDFFTTWVNGTNASFPAFRNHTVELTDENGVWVWENPFLGLLWLNTPRRFSLANSRPAGVTGPGTITQIKFTFSFLPGTIDAVFDHMRVYRNEEEILAVGSLSPTHIKTITTAQKYAIRLAAKRSTDG